MPLIIKNRTQSNNRLNWLNISGIKDVGDRIQPKNGARLYGGHGVVYFNQTEQNNNNNDPTTDYPSTDPNAPITPPDCPTCGGGIDPPTDPDNPNTPNTPQGCTCRSLDELGDYVSEKENQDFCDFTPVEDDGQYFPCLIGGDGKELRISCPKDENCDDDNDFDKRRQALVVELKFYEEDGVVKYGTVYEKIYDFNEIGVLMSEQGFLLGKYYKENYGTEILSYSTNPMLTAYFYDKKEKEVVSYSLDAPPAFFSKDWVSLWYNMKTYNEPLFYRTTFYYKNSLGYERGDSLFIRFIRPIECERLVAEGVDCPTYAPDEYVTRCELYGLWCE